MRTQTFHRFTGLPAMQRKPLPLRVAVVQMNAHLAFEGPGKLHLKEPFAEPHISQLHVRLLPGTPLLEDLERLQQAVAQAYQDGLLSRLRAILDYCAIYQTQLVVFPEYSIPGALLPQLRLIATQTGATLVAGTHLVTDELLEEPTYRQCFQEPPPVNHAIAPIIAPEKDTPVRYQLKLWPSQWEPDLDLGHDVQSFEAAGIKFGVAICIDFIRDRDEASAAKHQEWCKNHLLVVTSATPGSSPHLFEANARSLYQHFHIPVVFANHAGDGGGSTIFAYGTAGGTPLAANTSLPPLPATHEGICIAELRLDETAQKRPSSVIQSSLVQPLAYALIQPATADPELARTAETLAAATSTSRFKQRCRDQQSILARAARHYKNIPLVHDRWALLAKAASGLHRLDALKRLASDLWLPDDVPSIPEIEHALAQGTIQVLNGLIARDDIPAEDRDACIATLETIEDAAKRLQAPELSLNRPVTRAIVEKVVSVLLPDAANPTSPVHPDGSVKSWIADPGAPPADLLQAGFHLWPRAARDAPNSHNVDECSAPQFRDLETSLAELDVAATWVALQGSPPAWIGWSPNRTPALVVPPGHVVLAARIIPHHVDLKLARARAGRPLPVALLLGESEGLTIKLTPGIEVLDRAIRRLAVDKEHLRELANFEFSPERRDFAKPNNLIDIRHDTAMTDALHELKTWSRSKNPTATLCGAISDGRTTLVRTWLADLARDAILRDGIPILYVDGHNWRQHKHLSLLLQNRPPERIAALRLAVSSGNCLLILDNFDSTLPYEVPSHPFFKGWLVSGQTQFLLITCWKWPLGHCIRLASASPQKPWLNRAIISRGLKQKDLDFPPPDRLEQIVTQTTETIATVLNSPNISTDNDPRKLFEELALAIWSSNNIDSLMIPESELRRIRAARHERGDEPCDVLNLLGRVEMIQSVVTVAKAPTSPPPSNAWKWRCLHLGLRCKPTDRQPTNDHYWLGIPWDPLLHFFIAQALVRTLAEGDVGLLDTLPLHQTTVQYCHQHTAWPKARPFVRDVLTRPPVKSAASINALLLANADAELKSTPDAPWKLSALDLRLLDLDHSHLDHADLSSANLSRSSLRAASLRYANLTGTKLIDCTLDEADFSDACLTDARLSGATFNGATFVRADLKDADLSRTTGQSDAPAFDEACLQRTLLHAIDWAEYQPDEKQATPTVESSFSFSKPPRRPDDIFSLPRLNQTTAMAWSADDHFVATGDDIGRLWIWSSGPIRCLAVHSAHKGSLRSIAYSPDGTMIATAGDDQRVHIWSAQSLDLRTILRHPAPVTGLYWETDDILWTFAGSPSRWTAETWTEVPLLPEILAISDAFEGAVTPDGRYLAIVSQSGMTGAVRVFSLSTGNLLSENNSENTRLPSIDLARFRMLGGTETLQSIPLDGSSRPVEIIPRWHRFGQPRLPIESWSADGRYLAAYSVLSRFKIVDLSTSARPRLREGPASDTPNCLFSHRDHRLLTMKQSGPQVFDLDTATAHDAPQRELLSRWGFRLRWTSTHLRLCEPDWGSRQQPATAVDIDLGGCMIHRKNIVLDSDSIIGSLFWGARSEDNTSAEISIVREGVGYSVRNAANGENTFLEPHTDHLSTHHNTYAFWSSRGRFVAIHQAFTGHNECTIWETTKGTTLYHQLIPKKGNLLIVKENTPYFMQEARSEGPLHVIDTSRQSRLSVASARGGHVFGSLSGTSVVFTNNTNLCVVTSSSLLKALAQLAPSETKEADLKVFSKWTRDLEAHPGEVVISDSHDVLVVICNNEEIRIYRLSNGDLLQTLPTKLGESASLALAPNGKHLACFNQGILQIWNLARSELVARIILHEDGATLLAGPEFQRFRNPDNRLPALDGLLGRIGVHLWPLDRLTVLESKNLCADTWRLLADPPS